MRRDLSALLCHNAPTHSHLMLHKKCFKTFFFCFFVKSLRSLAHFNCVSFNQAALRAVLKPQNIPSSSQATQISVSFVCVYASSTLPFIVVFNRFSRCLGHCFRSFRSRFESISMNLLQNTGQNTRVALKGPLITHAQTFLL